MKDYDKFYRSLYLIRRVEEEIAKVYPTDKIKSPVHLSIGQEAVSVGVCQALKKNDIVFGTYRGHAMYLAKGGNLDKMIAELYGKSTGCAKGKGGSMHLVDVAAGIMGGSAVVSTTIPQAVGYAFGIKYQNEQALSSRNKKQVVISFFGDGATEEGVFHECLNFAALKKLPIIFICENNTYAIHSRQNTRQAFSSIYKLAEIYGIKSQKIKYDDVFLINKLVTKAIEKTREGKGPFLFEIMTYRYKQHVGPGDDFSAGYRSITEAKPWLRRDQVKLVGSKLNKKLKERIESEVEQEIAKAFEFAENSPFPDQSELYTDVFKEQIYEA